MVATIIIVAALWILAAYLCARAGVKRGWGFRGFFLLGVFLTPIPAATVLAIDLLQGNPGEREQSTEERLATLERLHAAGTLSREEYERQVAAIAPAAAADHRDAEP